MPQYEFDSFRAIAAATPRESCHAERAWVPNGPGKQHLRSKGMPSQAERKNAALQVALKAAEDSQNSLESRLRVAEDAFDCLDTRVERVVAAFEGHVMEATAAHVLIAKRLHALGVSI